VRRTRTTPVPRAGRRMGGLGVGRGTVRANFTLLANRGKGVGDKFVVQLLPRGEQASIPDGRALASAPPGHSSQKSWARLFHAGLASTRGYILGKRRVT